MVYEFLLLVLVPLVSVFGNCLVLLVIRKEKALRSISNYVIASLAVTDLLMALIAMPYTIYAQVTGLSDPDGVRSHGVDQAFMMIGIYLITVSIYHLSSISVIRHIAISHPLEFRAIDDNKKLAVILLVVYVTAFLPQIPVAIAIANNDNSTILHCGVTYRFDYSALYMTIIQVVVSYLAPLLVMIASMQMSVRVLTRRAKILPMTAFPVDDLVEDSQIPSRSRASSFANASIDGTGSTNVEHAFERRPSEDPGIQCETPLTKVAVTILQTSPEGVTVVNDYDKDDSVFEEKRDIKSPPRPTDLPSPNFIIRSKDFVDGTHEVRSRQGSLDASPRFTINDPELRAISRSSRASSPISRQGSPKSRHGSLDVLPSRLSTRRRSLMDQLDQSFDRFKEMLSPNGYVEERRGSVILRQRRMSMMGAINMKDQRALKTLCAVFCCFFVLYLPYFIMTLTSTICDHCALTCGHFMVVQWLAYLAPTASPYLYIFFSKDIRKSLLKIFMKRKR